MVALGGFDIPEQELEFQFARSSGAGGQNVNKVSSKAILLWDIMATTAISPFVKQRFLQAFGNRVNGEGVLVLPSDLYRDQPRNKEDCLQKLGEMLAQVARPPKKRVATKPTKSSQRRRVDEKKKHGIKKKQRRSSFDHQD